MATATSTRSRKSDLNSLGKRMPWGLYTTPKGSLFVPTVGMLRIHEVAKPTAVERRAEFPRGTFRKWHNKYGDEIYALLYPPLDFKTKTGQEASRLRPMVIEEVFKHATKARVDAGGSHQCGLYATLKSLGVAPGTFDARKQENPALWKEIEAAAGRGDYDDLTRDQFDELREMQRFEAEATLSAMLRAANKGIGKADRVSRTGVMTWLREWKDRYPEKTWIGRWLIRGTDPPEGVYVANATMIHACRSAFDYIAICDDDDLQIDRQNYPGLFKKKSIEHVELLKWLWGEREPLGWYVLTEMHEKLRTVSSQNVICAAAKIDANLPGTWRKDPVQSKALDYAIVSVSVPKNERPSTPDEWNSQSERVQNQITAFAQAHAVGARLKRADVAKNQLWSKRREAKSLGVFDDVERFINGVRTSTDGTSFARAGIVAPKVFSPRETLRKFREIAIRLRKENRLERWKDLPGFNEFFLDCVLPWKSNGRRYELKSLADEAVAQPAAEKEPASTNDNGARYAEIRTQRIIAEEIVGPDGKPITLAKGAMTGEAAPTEAVEPNREAEEKLTNGEETAPEPTISESTPATPLATKTDAKPETPTQRKNRLCWEKWNTGLKTLLIKRRVNEEMGREVMTDARHVRTYASRHAKANGLPFTKRS